MEFIDREIESFDQDNLNRKPFIGKVISSLKQGISSKCSFTMSINGKWGEGKSSVKNLIKQELLETKNPKYIFLDYNPWQWTREDQVIRHFFEEISSSLARKDDNRFKALAEKFKKYGEYLESGAEVVESFRGVIKGGVALLFAMSTIGAFTFSSKQTAYLEFLSLLSLLVLAFLEDVLKFFSSVCNLPFFKRKNAKNLIDMREDIKSDLLKFPDKIVVAIDDIDRLDKSEIKMLFKFIKINMNFPNIAYILFFDKKIVADSLGEDEVFEGREYLKKIVNVEYDLPKLDNGKFIQQNLFDSLESILVEYNVSDKFEQKRWRELYLDGVKPHFKNLRDVKRFSFSLRSYLKVHGADSNLEINIVDSIGLEIVRQFFPDFYEFIHCHKDIFTSDPGDGFSEKENKKIIEEAFDLLGEEAESLKAILAVLFPNSQRLWTNVHAKVDLESFANKRINDDDIFERYFSLSLGAEDFADEKFKAAIIRLGDSKKFMEFCDSFASNEQLENFLGKLLSFRGQFSKNQEEAQKILKTFYDIGDRVETEMKGIFEIPGITHVERLIHFYIKKQDFDVDKREIYANALEKAEGVYLTITDLYDEWKRVNIEKRGSEYYVFEETDEDRVYALLCKKLEDFKGRSAFKLHKELPRLLLIWRDVDQDAYKEWFSNYINEDKNFMDFLTKLECATHRESGGETSSKTYLSKNLFNNFFDDIDEVIHRVEKNANFEKQAVTLNLLIKLKENPDGNDRFD